MTVENAEGVGVNERTLVVTIDKGGLLLKETPAVEEIMADDDDEDIVAAAAVAAVLCGAKSNVQTIELDTSTMGGVAGRTSVVVCPSRTETGEATISIVDSLEASVTATATVTFATEPSSAGLIVTAPPSLERGGSGIVTVTANDENGIPIVHGHMVDMTAKAGLTSGFGECTLTPPGPLTLSPPDSAPVSAVLSTVGPVTECQIVVNVTGFATAITTVTIPVIEAGTTAVTPTAPTTAQGVSGGDPVAAGSDGFRSVDGDSNVGDVATAACAGGDTLSMSVPLDGGGFNKYFPATPIISDMDAADPLSDGTVIHVACNA